MPALPSARQLNRFFLLSWLIAVVQVAGLQGARRFAEACRRRLDPGGDVELRLHLPAAGAAADAPVAPPAGVSGRCAARPPCSPPRRRPHRTDQTLLFADRLIRDMYGFHINGFVVDLVLTPGGIAALGAGPGTRIAAGLVVLAFFAAQAGAYAWVMRRDGRGRWTGRIRWRWVLLSLALLSTGERVAYGYSAAANYPADPLRQRALPPLSAAHLPQAGRRRSASTRRRRRSAGPAREGRPPRLPAGAAARGTA